MDLTKNVISALKGLDVSSPFVSGILRSTGSNREKLHRLSEGYLSESKYKEIKELISFMSDDEVSSLIGDASGSVDEEEYQESFLLDKLEVSILEEEKNREFDTRLLLTAGNTDHYPVSFKKKFDIDNIDEWDVIIVGKLYNLTRPQSKDKILNYIGSETDVDVVSNMIGDLVYTMITIENGYFVLEDADDQESKKISYYDYFKLQGHSDLDAVSECISYTRKKIMSDFDKSSRENEFALAKFDKDVDDGLEMEFDGRQIVPKRRVKYDYAINPGGPQPLLIENKTRLVPIRSYVPFDSKRCSEALTMLDGKVTSDGMDDRLRMEIAFYTFKQNEIAFLTKYPYVGSDVKVNLSDWSNDELDEKTALEKIEYNLNTSKMDITDVPSGVVYWADLHKLNACYYEFKLTEAKYKSTLSWLHEKGD